MMTEFDDVLDDFHFAVCKTKELEVQLTALVEALEVGLSWMESLEKWIEFLPWINKSKLKRDKVRVKQALALVEGKDSEEE